MPLGACPPIGTISLPIRHQRVKNARMIDAGLKIKGRGTLKFRIDDDNGITHTINVPNSVHIPDLPMVLVSPQHWEQQMPDGIV